MDPISMANHEREASRQMRSLLVQGIIQQKVAFSQDLNEANLCIRDAKTRKEETQERDFVRI